jgi:YidC/Oxa1 family membrane protein insertase
MFEVPAALLAWFYGNVPGGYIVAIGLMSFVVMAVTTPLTLKSTKGMLEMQRLAPEMRRLQTEHRDDRQKLNEEMMKLYQEHKVNPMASCLPIVAQMPIFIIMFRVLRGLIYKPVDAAVPVSEAVRSAFGMRPAGQGFIPRYLSTESEMYQSLFDEHEMKALGLDLSLSAVDAVGSSFTTGLPYTLMVVGLAGMYFVQQRMVAARAAVSPTMSASQQKLMQYLPVVFAAFQLFFLSALVVYYIFQTLMRIGQQAYITRKFYGHDESLGRQAQRAGEKAREESKKNGETGGLLAQAKRDLKGPDKSETKSSKSSEGSKSNGDAKPARPIANKRVTPPKSRPTASQSGSKGRPTPSRQEAQAKRVKPKTSSKKRR